MRSLVNYPVLLLLLFLNIRSHARAEQSRHNSEGGSHRREAEHGAVAKENELYEIRIYEGAPPGTKATPNEALDKLLRAEKNCFAQLEVPSTSADDLEWLEFDSALLVFVTVGNVPTSSGRATRQHATSRTVQSHRSRHHSQAILHLMCSSNQMRSIRFDVHVTRRNRHAPKFSETSYEFYPPADAAVGEEIGRLLVIDNDPIIYNSQLQLSLIPPASSAVTRPTNAPSSSSEEETGQSHLRIQSLDHHQSGGQSVVMGEDTIGHWMILKNGSLRVQRLMSGDLQLYRPYRLRVLAADFGSPQLIATVNVTITPVAVSQPLNVRVNVANRRYQIFEWDPPVHGQVEKFRLDIRLKSESPQSPQPSPMHSQEVGADENVAMTRIRFPAEVTHPNSAKFEVTVVGVGAEGETPSQPHSFMLINDELQCEGECSLSGGIPMCYYGRFHSVEQYRDPAGTAHCLCYDGYTSPQCDAVESCMAERSLEAYGGIDWPLTQVNRSAVVPCPYNSNGEMVERKCVWDSGTTAAQWENITHSRGSTACKTQSSVLVHLALFANYAQKAEQTASGLMAAQRYLDSLLLFPSFQLNVSSAHFDSKIAEHAAHIIEIIAARNLSLVTGNTSAVREHLLGYMHEFAKRVPVPYLLESSGGGGLQLKTWYWLPGSNPVPMGRRGQIEEELLAVENEGDSRGEDDISLMIGGGHTRNGAPAPSPPSSFPTQLSRRCYIHLPTSLPTASLTHAGDAGDSADSVEMYASRRGARAKRHSSSYAQRPRILRAMCLTNSGSLYPGVQAGSPLLIVHLNELEELEKNGQPQKEKPDGELPTGVKALVGLRLGESSAVNRRSPTQYEPVRTNYTCARYDPSSLRPPTGWSREGLRLISHDFDRQGYLLCEVTQRLGVFALLPESAFEPPNVLAALIASKFPLVTGGMALAIVLFLLFAGLLPSSFSKSGWREMSPTLLLFLFTMVLVHSLHLLTMVLYEFVGPLPYAEHTAPPHLSDTTNIATSAALFVRRADTQVYLLLQYALLSAGAALALLNRALCGRMRRLLPGLATSPSPTNAAQPITASSGSGSTFIPASIACLGEAECTSGRESSAKSRRLRRSSSPGVEQSIGSIVGIALWAVVLPSLMCLATWLLDGYAYSGVITRETKWLSFNWTFALAFLLPLILIAAFTTICGFCTLIHARSMAHELTARESTTNSHSSSSSSHHLIASMRASPPSCKATCLLQSAAGSTGERRFIRNMSAAVGFSLIIMVQFYTLAFLFTLGHTLYTGVGIGLLHVALSLSTIIYVRLLCRLENGSPHRLIDYSFTESVETRTANVQNLGRIGRFAAAANGHSHQLSFAGNSAVQQRQSTTTADGDSLQPLQRPISPSSSSRSTSYRTSAVLRQDRLFDYARIGAGVGNGSIQAVTEHQYIMESTGLPSSVWLPPATTLPNQHFSARGNASISSNVTINQQNGDIFSRVAAVNVPLMSHPTPNLHNNFGNTSMGRRTFEASLSTTADSNMNKEDDGRGGDQLEANARGDRLNSGWPHVRPESYALHLNTKARSAGVGEEIPPTETVTGAGSSSLSHPIVSAI